MKMRSDLERAIYAAAFVQRLAEERATTWRSQVIAGKTTKAEREAAEIDFERNAADQAIEYAEFAVWTHRRSKRTKEASR